MVVWDKMTIIQLKFVFVISVELKFITVMLLS